MEIVDDGVTGHLFESQDSEAIAESMFRAREQAWSVADLQSSARRFDIESFYERFDSALAMARAAQTRSFGEVALEAGS